MRYILAIGLLSFAVAKLSSPYVDTYALPIWAYYGSVTLEILMALMLITGKGFKIASIGSIAFFVTGMLTAMVYDGDCG